MIVGYKPRAKEVNPFLVWVVKEVEYSLPFPDDKGSFFLPTYSLWKASETEECDSEICSVGEYCHCHLLCNTKGSKSFFLRLLAAAKYGELTITMTVGFPSVPWGLYASLYRLILEQCLNWTWLFRSYLEPVVKWNSQFRIWVKYQKPALEHICRSGRIGC